jgi:aspartyl-tRNA(Asn)/glutamyl-tRNA(Gln) amidotransferase subunit C
MIDREQVLRVAELARLKISEEEVELFTTQLGSILEFVEQLNVIDTSNVEPTCYVESPHDATRPDVETPSLAPEELLQNGPKVKNGFFAIPKVMG